MITLSQLTTLLGWASVINLAYLMLATGVLFFAKATVASLHSKMFGIDEAALPTKYFDFLANYKIVTLVFMVAPYIALKIMAG